MSLIPASVRAVYFDAVGTLLFPDPPAGDAYFHIGRRFGSRLELDDVRDRFRRVFAEQEAHDARFGHRTSECRELERWRHIVAMCLPDVSDPAACFDALYEHFAHPASWRVDPVARRLIDSLNRRRLSVGIASNFDHRLRDVVTGVPDLAGVERLVISAEVGWRKPAPEYFRALCENAGLLPEQVLLVGDDVENDFHGATRAGLHALLIDGRTTLADLIE